jgi:hypothetical protein
MSLKHLGLTDYEREEMMIQRRVHRSLALVFFLLFIVPGVGIWILEKFGL